MKTTEFNSSLTSAQLNENMFKKFGKRVDFNKYTREQLEDARNQLRTKLSQTETESKFNDLLANEAYQEDKQLLTLLNTRIKEMLGEAVINEKSVSQKQARFMAAAAHDPKFAKRVGIKQKVAKEFNKKDTGTKLLSKAMKKKKKKTNEDDGKYSKSTMESKTMKKTTKKTAKPDYLDFDGDGNKKEPMKTALKDKKNAPPFMKKKKKSSKVKESETNEMYHYDTKKGGRSVPPSDKLGRRPEKHGVIDDPEGYKGVVKGKNKHGKFPSRLRQMYSLNGPKGTLPEEMSESAKPKCCCEMKGKAKCPVHSKKAVKENRRMYYKMIVEGMKRYIAEDEEAKAENIADAADMVEDFTGWMQKVGQYQTKTMLELSDEIRKNFGQAESEAFKSAVTPVLQQTLEVLTQSREAISKAVASLATGEAPNPMGMSGGIPGDMGAGGMPGELPPEPTSLDSMNMPGEDEFGASDAAAGGAEISGREMRESREIRRLRRIQEGNSLISRLSR